MANIQHWIAILLLWFYIMIWKINIFLLYRIIDKDCKAIIESLHKNKTYFQLQVSMFFISLDISYWHEWGKICTFWLSFRFDILQLIIRIIALILFNLSPLLEKSNTNNSTDLNNVIHKVSIWHSFFIVYFYSFNLNWQKDYLRFKSD